MWSPEYSTMHLSHFDFNQPDFERVLEHSLLTISIQFKNFSVIWKLISVNLVSFGRDTVLTDTKFVN